MRNILPQEKNPLLRKVAQPVAVADITGTKIKTLVKEMKNLLSKEEYGVALAAPQVGESLRLFIVSGKAVARDARNALDEPEDDMADDAKPAKRFPCFPIRSISILN